jgi:hypothetical protein
MAAQKTERVVTEVDPVTGITFKVTLKFDQEKGRVNWPMAIFPLPSGTPIHDISVLIGQVEGGE